MTQGSEGEAKAEKRLPRRQFLANILFTGGALTVVALQSEYGLADPSKPKDKGRELPKGKPQAKDGWDLPDDLMDSPNPPPNPSPTPPPPPPQGAMRPPQTRGRVKPPDPPPPPPTAGVPLPPNP
jgi:hypothetical protein